MMSTEVLVAALAAFLAGSLVFTYIFMSLRRYDFAISKRKSKEVVPSEEIMLPTPERLKLALENFTETIENLKPDHLLGINTGGRLVSSYVANRLKIPPTRCSYLSTTDVREARPVLDSLSNQLSGRVVVIDDITRRGQTLELVNQYLVADAVSGVSNVRDIKFATLVLVSNREKAKDGYFSPDAYSYVTEHRLLSLPWSRLSASVNEAFASRACGNAYDRNVLSAYARITTDTIVAEKLVEAALAGSKDFDSALSSLIEEQATTQ